MVWKRGFNEVHDFQKANPINNTAAENMHEAVSMPSLVGLTREDKTSLILNAEEDKEEEKANPDPEREEREAARLETEKRKTEEKALLVDKLYNVLFANTPLNNIKRAAVSFFSSHQDFPLSKLFINQFNLERGAIAKETAKQWISDGILDVIAQLGNFTGDREEDSDKVAFLYHFLCQKISMTRKDPNSAVVTEDFAQKAKELFAADQEALTIQNPESLLKEKVAKEAKEAIGQIIVEIIQARPKNELLPKGIVIVVEKIPYNAN